MTTVEVAGYPLHYSSHGLAEPGTPLVLIHGAGGVLTQWPAMLRTLPGRPIFALDLPGHGASPGNGSNDIGVYAAGIVEWLNVLDLERVIMLGHSMGGAIVLTVALSLADRLVGLGLLGTGVRLPVAASLLNALRVDYLAAAARIATWAYGRGTDPGLVLDYSRHLQSMPPKLVYGDFVACNAFDVADRIGRITLPTLVVCGAEDRLTPPKFSEFLAVRLPYGELHLIAGAGHMAMVEQADEVTLLVGDFADRLDRVTDNLNDCSLKR